MAPDDKNSRYVTAGAYIRRSTVRVGNFHNFLVPEPARLDRIFIILLNNSTITWKIWKKFEIPKSRKIPNNPKLTRKLPDAIIKHKKNSKLRWLIIIVFFWKSSSNSSRPGWHFYIFSSKSYSATLNNLLKQRFCRKADKIGIVPGG